jgi:hypothetical protein
MITWCVVDNNDVVLGTGTMLEMTELYKKEVKNGKRCKIRKYQNKGTKG